MYSNMLLINFDYGGMDESSVTYSYPALDVFPFNSQLL